MINVSISAIAETPSLENEFEKDTDITTLTPELLSMVGGGDGMVNI